jgi:hypothetical protein
MNKLALGSLIILLAGCAAPFQGGPSKEEFEKADFGPPPARPEDAIRTYMKEVLKDPFSAQYEFASPEKAWFGKEGGLLVSRDIQYGWRVIARVNAKNSFGGYVGWQTWIFTFRNGQLMQVNQL